jgi:diaminopimelate decarboxylase
MGLRVNTGVVAGFHPHVRTGVAGRHFGVPLAEAVAVARAAAAAGATIEGLHCHLGSDILDPGAHLEAAEILLDLSCRLDSIRWVNLGGGYGTPFTEDGDDYDLARLFDGLDELRSCNGDRVDFRFEPGAHICRDAGWLVARVTTSAVGDGIQHLECDASVNHLAGALLYGTQHPLTLVDDDHPAGVDCPTAAGIETIVTGNLMQPGDVLAAGSAMPLVRPGALLAFGMAGAYTSVRSTTFNGRPLPAEVWLAEDGTELIRRRLGAAELYAATYA